MTPKIPRFQRDRTQSQAVTELTASEGLIQCLRTAFAESRRRGFSYTGTEQLLFGIFQMAATDPVLNEALQLLKIDISKGMAAYEEWGVRSLPS